MPHLLLFFSEWFQIVFLTVCLTFTIFLKLKSSINTHIPLQCLGLIKENFSGYKFFWSFSSLILKSTCDGIKMQLLDCFWNCPFSWVPTTTSRSSNRSIPATFCRHTSTISPSQWQRNASADMEKWSNSTSKRTKFMNAKLKSAKILVQSREGDEYWNDSSNTQQCMCD